MFMILLTSSTEEETRFMKQFSDLFLILKVSSYIIILKERFLTQKIGNHIFLQNITLTTDINTLESEQ